MDGIAVRAADLAAASPCAGAEGQPEDARADGRRCDCRGPFEWIDTGDPMPAGADTVVMRERLLPQADGSVLITARAGGRPGRGAPGHAARGRNVRTAGEDFGAGETLVQRAAAPARRPGRRGGRRARDRGRGPAARRRDHPDR